MLTNNALHLIQLMGLKTIICRQFNGVKPKFSLIIVGLDVYMGRLSVFVAEESEPIATFAQYSRHSV